MKLPNFFIIGSARSGTTGLYNNLVQHPEIYMPRRKELHFFSHGWHKGLDWYKSHFENYNNEKIIGEASVSYTYPDLPQFFERMKETVGTDLKFIYIVRDPTVRAISHYHYYRYYGKKSNSASFKEAFENETFYRKTSLYSNFIKQYQDHFGKDSMHIVVFEEMIKEPEKTLADVLRFLDVAPDFVPKDIGLKTNQTFVPKSNGIYKLYFKFSRSALRTQLEKLIPAGKKKRVRNWIRTQLGQKDKPKVPQDIIKEARVFFEPEICRMESILNRDLSIWRDNKN